MIALIILTVVSLIGFVLMLRKGIKEAKKDFDEEIIPDGPDFADDIATNGYAVMTDNNPMAIHNIMPDGPIEDEEYSLNAMLDDEVIKRAALRVKLNKIEEERK